MLLIQDFWVACRGGKTAFDWNDGLLLTVKNVNELTRGIEAFIGAWDIAVEKIKAGRDMFTHAVSFLGAITAGDPRLLLPRNQAGGTSSFLQNNSITNHISGANNPEAVGREVGRSTSRHITDAFGQMPLPAR